jgi:DNA-binding transcriptional LysR family regulator
MTPFCPDALRVICPTGHPLAENRYVKPSQLADEKFVLREEGSATRDLMVKALREVGLDVDRLRIEMELGSTSAVISAVESGAGISMASQWAVRRPLAEGLIKEIKVVSCRPTRQFGLVRLRKRRLTPQADRFMKFVLRKKSFFKRHVSEGPTAGDTRS